MKSIGIKRFYNKNMYLNILFTFLLLLISFFIKSGIITDTYTCYKNPIEGISLWTELKNNIDMSLQWETGMASAVSYLYSIFPIFCIFSVIPFWNEKKTYYVLAANKIHNRKLDLFKAVLSYGLMGGLGITLGIFLFLCLGWYFFTPNLINISSYANIFPKDFYYNNTFLFYCFIDFSIYFLLAILFSIMACGCILCVDNKLFAMLVPIFVYIMGSNLGLAFGISEICYCDCISVFCSDIERFIDFFKSIPSLVILDTVLVFIGVKKNEQIIN